MPKLTRIFLQIFVPLTSTLLKQCRVFCAGPIRNHLLDCSIWKSKTSLLKLKIISAYQIGYKRINVFWYCYKMILILVIFEEIGWQPLYVTSLSAFFTTPFACNRPFMSPLWWSVKFLNIQSYRINESWIVKKSPRHVLSRHYQKFDVWIIEKMCYLTKTWLTCCVVK